MDTLTFASPILLRHLTFSEAKKMPISEIHLDIALQELGMSMDQVRFLQLAIRAYADISSLSYVFSSGAITSNLPKALVPKPL